MTREEIRLLVTETIKQYAEELFTLFFKRMIAGALEPAKPAGNCSGGGCNSGGGGCCKTKTQIGPQASGLILEEDITALHSRGQTSLTLTDGTIVTPLAVDKARDLGVALIRGQS